MNKKGLHASKKAIPLNSVNTNNIVISYRVKHNDGEMISYELQVARGELWVANLRKLIYELRFTFNELQF